MARAASGANPPLQKEIAYEKVHAALIAGFGLILAGSLVAGGFHLYGSQTTLPKRTSIAGWDISGQDIAQVRAALEAKLQALEATPLTLKAKGDTGLSVSLQQAGVTYEAQEFRRALKTLTDGPLMDRVQARYNWNGNWNIGIHLEISQLMNSLSPAWEKESFGVPVDAVRQITSDDRVVYTPGTTSFEVDWHALELALQAAVPTRLAGNGALEGKRILLEVPLTVKQPNVTLQALRDQGIERKITQFSTSLGASGPGRSFNVEAPPKPSTGPYCRLVLFSITEKRSRRPRQNMASARLR